MNKFLLVSLLIAMFACEHSRKGTNSIDTLPYYNNASFTPHWFNPNDAALDTFHRIPSFKLINQEGNAVTEKSFEGKIYVTDFFFTSCPGICPKMTTNMAVLQDTFIHDQDVLLLSHSATPNIDSVSVLKAYADEKGVLADKWHLVTGDRNEIYALGRKQYFVEEDLGLTREADDFLHTENFVLIDKDRHIRGIYNGLNRTSINQLIGDIRTLQREGK